MNAQQLTDRADELAENGIIKLAGRIFMIVCGPAIVWLGATMWDIARDQAQTKGEISASIAQLRGEIAVLGVTVKQQMDGRYRDSDAIRDFKSRDQKDSEQDRRIGENSDRIRALESRRP